MKYAVVVGIMILTAAACGRSADEVAQDSWWLDFNRSVLASRTAADTAPLRAPETELARKRRENIEILRARIEQFGQQPPDRARVRRNLEILQSRIDEIGRS